MEKLRLLVAISMGLVSQPMLYSADAIIINAVEDTAVPASISIKTGQPSAQMQIEIQCTSDPSIETQTQTATADEKGKAIVQYNRVEGMTYTINITVNGEVYTMTDDTGYSSTCDGLTVEGIRAGMDADGNQALTVTVSLSDVPETKPDPETPTEDDEQKKEDTTSKEDAKAHEKDSEGDSAHVQKVDTTPSTVAQGMPTGCRVWNPVNWFISLFRVCL